MSEKTFRMYADTSGLDALVASVGNSVNGALRPAAQAGAQVLYDEVKRNVAAIGKVTGNLERSIYQVYTPEKSNEKRANYNVSYNYTKAPHGHLIEYGHWQYFQTAVVNGRWVTLVRPEMQGKPKPKRRASLAEKMAYYVPRKKGITFIPGRSFMRNAALKLPQAAEAVEAELLRILNGKTPGRNT